MQKKQTGVSRRDFMKYCTALTASIGLPLSLTVGRANATETYEVLWSHYTGWEPWEYARYAGILDSWAKKMGISIKLSFMDKYGDTLSAYVGSKRISGCVMTNMDMITTHATAPEGSTVLIVGDTSHGNDAIVGWEGDTIKKLKDRKCLLVELSVSEYLLARALEMNGMSLKDVSIHGTDETGIVAGFKEDRRSKEIFVVTYNPFLMDVMDNRGANNLFSSADIPNEIIDMMVVKDSAPDTLKRALTGAWYDTMTIMSSQSAQQTEMIEFMAISSAGKENIPAAWFMAQLKTTNMFYNASRAVLFTESAELKDIMQRVRAFCVDRGFTERITDPDAIGMKFPDGTVMGDNKNILVTFDTSYMQMAAEGKLV